MCDTRLFHSGRLLTENHAESAKGLGAQRDFYSYDTRPGGSYAEGAESVKVNERYVPKKNDSPGRYAMDKRTVYLIGANFNEKKNDRGLEYRIEKL